MFMILIDIAILMLLLKAVCDEDIELPTAGIIALVTAGGTFVLALALTSILGIWGLVLTAIILAVGLGLAISAFLGVEIKRAMLTGVLFALAHVVVNIIFYFMFHA